MASGGWKAASTCRRSGWTPTARAKRRASSRATCWSRSTAATSANVGSLERQSTAPASGRRPPTRWCGKAFPLEAPLILAPADRSLYLGLRLIALVYLGIGLYVLLRRWTAPKSTHFYVFCLVSFVFYSFHYTGKLNDFDWIIYWANVVAWLLQPALFLHFALTFPERQAVLTGRRWLIPAIYVPGALILAMQIIAAELAAAQRDPALQPRPAADGVSGRLLRGGDLCAVAQLPPCPLGHPAAADEVGDARHHPLGRAVHAFLRHSRTCSAACRRWACGCRCCRWCSCR